MVKITESTENHLIDIATFGQTEFYRLVVNSIQDYAIFLMDPRGVIATWNLGAQKLKGYRPHEIIGKHFSVFYGPEDKAVDKPGKELVICQREGRVEDEGWRLKSDGTRFWANVLITALRDKEGHLVGYVKVTRDLTERKRQEDDLYNANIRLRQQSVELEALNQSKDEFISLASHQLRTPASGVKQFLGLLLEGYAGELTPLQEDYLKRAYDSNNRQLDLVNDLLRVAQVDAGKVKLQKKPVDIEGLLKDIVDEQSDSFKSRQQTVKTNTQPVQADIDKMRFRMVLENLIDNASKYTPDGGKITVSLSQTPKQFKVVVKDSGVGIEAAALPKLFSKFSRIPNSLSESVGGSGLGLYWVNKIVELHHGKITVASIPGRGSTFTVTIPKEGNQ